jgi:hypothetical protein
MIIITMLRRDLRFFQLRSLFHSNSQLEKVEIIRSLVGFDIS